MLGRGQDEGAHSLLLLLAATSNCARSHVLGLRTFCPLLGSLQLVQQNLRLPTQSEFSSFVWPVVDAVLVTNPYDLTRCVATTSQAARCAFRVGTTLKVVNAVPEMFGALYHGITVGLQFGVLVVFVVGLIAYARSHLEKVRSPPPLLLLLLLLLLCPKHAPS